MNVAFTIVAKNYLAFAITLADSIKKINPELDFYILIVDDIDGVDESYLKQHKIIFSKDIGINSYWQMAFKYNVTEFSTAIKPFFIDYLFNKIDADKVIYLDPDIYVYSSLNYIYDLLNEAEVVITPHFVTMETNYSGTNPETEYLFSGIYNLGFIALKKSQKSVDFINWWMDRLEKYCYGDRLENLHVDQKWIDFLPAFLTQKELNISHHPGLNIAYWNIHEREFVENKLVRLKNSATAEKVIFLHHSGLNPLDIYNNKQCPQIDVKKYSLWEAYIKEYAQLVIENHYKALLSLGYSYNSFNDGETILPFHRRMYRKLIEVDDKKFQANPFETGANGFYDLLQKNKLLIGKEQVVTKITNENLASSNNKLKKINFLLKMLLKLIGFKNYITILRFSQKYFRPENQIFLLKEYKQKAEETYFAGNN